MWLSATRAQLPNLRHDLSSAACQRQIGMDSCCCSWDLPLLVAALKARGRREQPGSGQIGWF